MYLYLYSGFEGTSGGFEEWYVRKFGLLTNTATVTSVEGAGGSDTEEVIVSAGADYGIPVVTATLLSASSVAGDPATADVTKEGEFINENLIEYTVTISNQGNVTLSNVTVTDSIEGGSTVVLDNSTVSGDVNNNGELDLGETWTYTYTREFGQDAFDVNGDALLDNTVVVDAAETHPTTSSVSIDVSKLIFIGQAINAKDALWWSDNLAEWDGDVTTESLESDLGIDDALLAVDSNGDGAISPADNAGILIGDINANGLTDIGESTLFVELDAAQQLIGKSGSLTDMREVMIAEALAAQLNINNMSADSTLTDNPEGPYDLVSEAVAWLTGQGPYTYADLSTGNIDTDGDGILSVGNNKNFEYDIKNDLLTADALLSTPMSNKDPGDSLSQADEAWMDEVFVDALNTKLASGEDLRNALHEFNVGTIAVDPHGGYIAEFDDQDVMVGVAQENDIDVFWDYVI